MYKTQEREEERNPFISVFILISHVTCSTLMKTDVRNNRK